MPGPYTFPVDLSSIMLFASAIGETNHIYYDQAYAAQTPLGSVIAPPTFPIASAHWDPNHVFRGMRRIPEPAQSPEKVENKGGGAKRRPGGGDLSRALHGEQRFDYHGPMRPGMKLAVSTRPGRSWEKEGRRGGTLRFSESITEYRDEQGELVVTATSVGIITSKTVEG